MMITGLVEEIDLLDKKPCILLKLNVHKVGRVIFVALREVYLPLPLSLSLSLPLSPSPSPSFSPVTTQCVVTELEGLGQRLSGAMYVAKRFQLRNCGHHRDLQPAPDCVKSMISEHLHCFSLGSGGS